MFVTRADLVLVDQSRRSGTDAAVQQADALLAASAALRKDLQEYERVLRRMRARVLKGQPNPVPEVVPDLVGLRVRVNEGFDELESCRRRWRVAYFRLQVKAGMSYGEIARQWGLSRQLVSRLMNDALPDDEADAHDSQRVG